MNSTVTILINESEEKITCLNTKFNISVGDYVVLKLEHILYSGRVLEINKNISSNNEIIRKFTKDDYFNLEKNKLESIKALKEAKKMQNKLGLNMSFVDSYYTFDKKQLFFLFVSDNRVDFRQLAKKLADKYRTRIELRQIGIRDKAKRIGGIGPCGLFLCCNTYLTDFNSVSINMAKNQFLALNPSKINGVCGRLLCCLNYENENYTEMKSIAPKLGSMIEIESGIGKVVAVDIFKKTCSVALKNKNIITVNYNNESIK